MKFFVSVVFGLISHTQSLNGLYDIKQTNNKFDM